MNDVSFLGIIMECTLHAVMPKLTMHDCKLAC